VASLGILYVIRQNDYLKTTGGGHKTQEGIALKGQSVTRHGQLSSNTGRHFPEYL
jgi:hypothetical protein